VIRALPNGSVVRIKDVGRVELGADTYSWSTSASNKPRPASGDSLETRVEPNTVRAVDV
jgi:multidrug efflux pump subunit AcrB